MKRIYVPLPDLLGRNQLYRHLLAQGEVQEKQGKQGREVGSDAIHELTAADIEQLVCRTKGYSGADIRALCTEAAMGPMRELARSMAHRGNLKDVRSVDVPLINMRHFENALEVSTLRRCRCIRGVIHVGICVYVHMSCVCGSVDEYLADERK